MISDQDFEKLKGCAEALPMDRQHDINDYVVNLFLAVLDFMMKVATVNKALTCFRANRRDMVHDLPTLKAALAQFPDDKAENAELAQYLWGNNHWTRAGMLRELADYFKSIGIVDQTSLVTWARSAEFQRDFEGRVKGLGFAVFQIVLMRCEVDTVKPDTHTRAFAGGCLGWALSDADAVDVIARTAAALGIPARSLDVAIWELQNGNVEPNSREIDEDGTRPNGSTPMTAAVRASRWPTCGPAPFGRVASTSASGGVDVSAAVTRRLAARVRFAREGRGFAFGSSAAASMRKRRRRGRSGLHRAGC